MDRLPDSDISQQETVGDSAPDELTHFLFSDASSDKASASNAQQIVDDMTEAKKPGYTRRQEVDAAIADPQHQLTRQARGWGVRIARSGHMGFDELSEVLTENHMWRFQPSRSEVLDLRAIADLLGDELRSREQGGFNIYNNLRPEEVTPEAGARLREGQKRVVTVKAVLFGIAEELCKNGRLDEAVVVLQQLGGSVFRGAPDWFIPSLAEQVLAADINDPTVRQLLEKLISGVIYFPSSEDEKKIKEAGETGQLSPMLQIIKRAYEARDLTAREAREAQEREKQRQYEERLTQGRNHLLLSHVQQGEEGFHEYARYERSYSKRAINIGGAQGILASLPWDLKVELTQNDQLRGVVGHLQALDSIANGPEVMDRIINALSGSVYLDLANKSRTDYAAEGRLDAWHESLRESILLEVYGDALGYLVAATLDSDELNRQGVLQGALQVIGGGRAQEFLAGSANLSPAQQLTRSVLTDFMRSLRLSKQEIEKITDPLSLSRIRQFRARHHEYERINIATVLERVKSLPVQANRADDASMKRREEELAALREQERSRAEWRTRIDGAREGVAHILHVRDDELPHLRESYDAIYAISGYGVPDFIKIVEVSGESGPVIDIIIDPQREAQVKLDLEAVREQIQQAPSPVRELDQRLARLEAEQRLMQEVRPLIETVNKREHKIMRSRMFGLAKRAMVSPRAFDGIPQPAFQMNSDVARKMGELAKAISFVTVQEHPRKVEGVGTLFDQLERLSQGDLLKLLPQVSTVVESISAHNRHIDHDMESFGKEVDDLLQQKARAVLPQIKLQLQSQGRLEA